tara:strand:- start:99 stop:1406 length:1308 start_codon:yes stop_codon:yes gene_type:complete
MTMQQMLLGYGAVLDGISITSANASGWSTPNWSARWSGSIFGSYNASNSFDSNTGSLTAFTNTGSWDDNNGAIPFTHSFVDNSFIRRDSAAYVHGANNSKTVNSNNWRQYMINDNNHHWGRMLGGTQVLGNNSVTAMTQLSNGGDGPDTRWLASDGKIVVENQNNMRIVVGDSTDFGVGDYVQNINRDKSGYVYAKSGTTLDLWKTTGTLTTSDRLFKPTLAELVAAKSNIIMGFSGNNNTTDLSGNSNTVTNPDGFSAVKKIWKSYDKSFKLAGSGWDSRVEVSTFTPSNSGWSIEWWVYPTSWAGYYLLHCGSGSLSWNVQGHEMRFYSPFSSGIVTWTISTGQFLNHWHFCQVHYDGSNVKYRFNGTERASFSGNTGTPSQVVFGNKTSSDPFPITGYIQDIAIYNGANIGTINASGNSMQSGSQTPMRAYI